jgi:probable HAF family extracellular repeat protein
LLFAAILAGPVAALAQEYTVKDLGTLGGAEATPSAINASGEVVGYSTTAGNVAEHAFLYSNGIMQDLGTLGGTNSYGLGINASGQVTGDSYTTTNIINPTQHAFLYSNGSMQDLGTLPGFASSRGEGINASGQVTGSAGIAGPFQFQFYLYGFLYSNGTMQSLENLDTILSSVASTGYGINANGQVTGSAFNQDHPASYAFIYINGHFLDLNSLIPSRGAARYTLLSGQAINDSGQIVVNALEKSTLYPSGIGRALLLTPMKINSGSE